MTKQASLKKFGWICTIIMGVAVGCGASTVPEAEPLTTPDAAVDEGSFISREGVNVEFALRPLRSEKTGPAISGDWADITFRVTDASTGEPIKGRYPAAWMDLGKAWEAKGGRPMTCRDRLRCCSALPHGNTRFIIFEKWSQWQRLVLLRIQSGQAPRTGGGRFRLFCCPILSPNAIKLLNTT